MTRTFTTEGRKVKCVPDPCEFCGHEVRWERDFLLPSGYRCSNPDCESHSMEYDDDYDDGINQWDFTQG